MITQSNTGHGHVVPRADGVKMRCGGLALCATCQMEKQTLEKSLNPTPPAAQVQGEQPVVVGQLALDEPFDGTEGLEIGEWEFVPERAVVESMLAVSTGEIVPLMTVAQHERIVAALSAPHEHGELWAVHAEGPDDLYAAFSREDAERHANELNAIKVPDGISISAVVIPSPWGAVEHWQYLAEQEREHVESMRAALSAPPAAETEQSIAADCYWHIAEVLNTQDGWSVQEHVEFMREIIQDASEFLHDIPESAVGGDDKAVELCRRIRLCLAGVAPECAPPLFPAPPAAGVPEGWKLVPIDPTPAMLAAFVEADGKAVKGYKAMLAAAPTPPASEQQRAVVMPKCSYLPHENSTKNTSTGE